MIRPAHQQRVWRKWSFLRRGMTPSKAAGKECVIDSNGSKNIHISHLLWPSSLTLTLPDHHHSLTSQISFQWSLHQCPQLLTLAFLAVFFLFQQFCFHIYITTFWGSLPIILDFTFVNLDLKQCDYVPSSLKFRLTCMQADRRIHVF